MTKAGLLIISLVLAGCASLNQEIIPEPKDDAIIATQIKAGLIDASELDAAAIQVEVDQGKIMLTGFVETDAQKQQAANIAQNIAGSSIDNQLTVKSE